MPPNCWRGQKLNAGWIKPLTNTQLCREPHNSNPSDSDMEVAALLAGRYHWLGVVENNAKIRIGNLLWFGAVAAQHVQAAALVGYPIIAVDLFDNRLIGQENGATHLINTNDEDAKAAMDVSLGSRALMSSSTIPASRRLSSWVIR